MDSLALQVRLTTRLAESGGTYQILRCPSRGPAVVPYRRSSTIRNYVRTISCNTRQQFLARDVHFPSTVPRSRRLSILPRAASTGSQTTTGSQENASAKATWQSRLSGGTAELDALLAEGKEEEALALVKRLAGSTGESSETSESVDGVGPQNADEKVFRAFGAASQVPRRSYTLEELKLHKIDPARMLAPRDTTLAGVRQGGQLALLAGLVATWWGEHLDQWQLLGLVIGLLFIGTVDQVSTGGGGEALLVDTLGHLLNPTYRKRVALHEAGHFLISYLVGIPPRGFTLSSLDAYQRYGALNVQAGTTFLDLDFQKQTRTWQIKSDMLDAVSCVALAGVCAEYLQFGIAEGGVADIQQLDFLYRSLGFTQRKSDDVVRWAVLNVATLLRRHKRLHEELADVMLSGESVGQCIALIEKKLAKSDLV
ncbi:hypothetical protein CLOM_g6133 [Closterium sp. NIES-68]|nr:hypothetical protein CLOM_g21728 [Closterium sp. NIES-68]GJP46883.1 hypothetical protein CLOM_g6133 [Closterium sp. NIES-68]GJP60871.1 hypothetical protein CLOP_g18085 [Closterium sp. NIES-67]GJP86755.1 hypothetical protein CLOP_g16740 [Closterium sp. NIES-67]